MPYRLPITAMTRACDRATDREPLKNYALTCHDPRAVLIQIHVRPGKSVRLKLPHSTFAKIAAQLGSEMRGE